MNTEFVHVETGAYFSVPGYTDYEICDTFPYEIRKRSTRKVVKESINKNSGYVTLYLNKNMVYKHRIVATTFIPNPNNFPQVDHINHDRTDFHINNLRWVSSIQNNNNLSNQTFVDDIPGDSIIVDRYGNWEFDFLYYNEERDQFYFYNGLNYTVRPIHMDKIGRYKILATDLDGKRRTIMLNKFKREYGLD